MIRFALYLRATLGYPLSKCARISVLATLPGLFNPPQMSCGESGKDRSDQFPHAGKDARRVA